MTQTSTYNNNCYCLLLLLVLLLSACTYPQTTFAAALMIPTNRNKQQFRQKNDKPWQTKKNNNKEDTTNDHHHNRRDFLTTAASSVISLLSYQTGANAAVPEAQLVERIRTPSGLEYRDFEEGAGKTPRYGQLLKIKFKASLSLPNDPPSKKPEEFDSASSFLLKHGSNKVLAGIEEGLHTMKVGGKRRMYIPPKLGFVDIGVGPIPEGWFDRRKLNGLLDEMIKQRGGRLIYDIELLSIIDDEADQGYYDDQAISPEDFENLRMEMTGGTDTTRIGVAGDEV